LSSALQYKLAYSAAWNRYRYSKQITHRYHPLILLGAFEYHLHLNIYLEIHTHLLYTQYPYYLNIY